MNAGGFEFVFSMAAGRVWWQTFDPLPAISESVDTYLAEFGPPDCAERHDRWQSGSIDISSKSDRL
jgi:hypothetical protein